MSAIAPRALADSRLAAKITLHQRGYAGAKINLTVRDVSANQPKVLASRPITLGPDGNLQTETVMFDIGGAGARTLQIAAAPLPGEENTANNTLTRVVNVGSDPRRILYIEGEPRWEYKFIRQAEEDDRMVQIASMDRTTENKIYRQGISDPKELAEGFPSRAEDLFVYQGLIIGSVEAGYFTPAQQELIHEFVDRRGGGLLLLGGQFALADGGWNASRLTDLFPTTLPTQPGTFHREADPKSGTTHTTAELAPAGVDSIITRLVDDPAANAAKWKKLPYLMDYEDPGTPKPGAAVLANMITPEGRKLPLADHRKLRPRPHRHHGHRRQLALADEFASGRHRSRFVLATAPAMDGFRYPRLRCRFRSRADAARQRRRDSHRRGSRSTLQPRSRRQSRSSYPGPERRQRPGRNDTGAR